MAAETNFVSEFYGKDVQQTSDLIFSACCVADYDMSLLDAITDEVKAKRYGCGSPIPQALAGATVLDLGSGAGIDCFIAAQLVGPEGQVIGVDMTTEQLAIARRNVAPIMDRIGLAEPNVRFVEAQIEKLPLESNSVDVVISNCVINLSSDKVAVFAEIHRVLKPGGEFYISDIVTNRRVPAHLAEDKRLFSECLTGAAYVGDLRRIMTQAGFLDVRTTSDRPLDEVIEGIGFSAVNLRGFKLPLEDACEDYGQVAVYKGTIGRSPLAFDLDDHHHFPAGAAVRICKNTADMLTGSRYAPHFEVSGPLSHLGLFDCAPAPVGATTAVPAASSGACC